MRSLTTLFLGLVLGAFAGAAGLFYGLQGLGSVTVQVNRGAVTACPCPEGSCPCPVPAGTAVTKVEPTAKPETTTGEAGDVGNANPE